MRRLASVGAVIALALSACGVSHDAEFSADAVSTAAQVAVKVDANALRPFIEELLRGRAAETAVTSAYSIQAPLTHIGSMQLVDDKLTALGYSPVRETFGPADVQGTNVYVDVAGDSPELVLVTGHHDAWFQSGADDNGSALAVIVEVARSLKGAHFRRTIRLIAFDREEEGLLGAAAYIRTHVQENIRMVLNMDGVGYASHEAGSQDAPPGFSLRDKGDFIAVLANGPAHSDASRVVHLAGHLPQPVDTLGLLVSGDGHSPGGGGFLRSDHSRFWLRGTPALFITDTANYRNHNYHTPDDTPEKLDYDFLNRVAQLVAAAAAAFAESE